MDINVIDDCLAKSLQGEMQFPEVVRALLIHGVERYEVDLVQLQKVNYGIDGTVYVEDLPYRESPAIATSFCQAEVQAAIRASQEQQIDYPEFLRQAMHAGTVKYSVYLTGRKVIYFGRGGEMHIEQFPDWL